MAKIKEVKLPLYTRKGIDRIIRDLIGWAQVTEHQHYPPHFVKKHPWTMKYLGFYGEAVAFKKLVHDEDLVVKEDVNEMMAKYREERGLPPRVRIRVSVREIRTRSDIQTFTFIFEEVKSGVFKCLNG
jgi:hypothetical protein